MHRLFSFYTHTLNFGDKVRKGTNPFTGETTEFPIDHGMTDEEIEAIQDIFDAYEIDGPEPEFEGYAMYSDEGSSLRFRCNNLDDSDLITCIPIELVTPALTDEILSIILQVARAGNLAFTSVTGEDVRIVDSVPTNVQLRRWPDARTISSISEMRDWLTNTIGSREVRV